MSQYERKHRLEHNIALAFQKYLKLGGCALPGCPCMIHSALGVPQADYIREVLTPKPSAYPRGGIPMFRKPTRTR